MLSTVTYRKKEMEVLVNVSKTKVMVIMFSLVEKEWNK